MAARAFIAGCSGPGLTKSERGFFRDAEPWGFILFARNVENPSQVYRLTQELRDAVGRDAPVLIDQEGGRVQRLRPPHWREYPPGKVYGDLFDRDPERGCEAAQLGARLIAEELHAAGIDVDCLPIADVPVDDADPIIGDRAYGAQPEKVSAIGRAIADGLLEGGVLPVLKHIPGHGRATADSHEQLPIVSTEREILEATDFAPFRALADLPLGMTAHVVFTAIDPDAPATTSSRVIEQIVRRHIAFDGLLMSDDLAMKALEGRMADRAAAALSAGCDMILHCNGLMGEMEAVAETVPLLSGKGAERAERALSLRIKPATFDAAAAWTRFSAMIGTVSANRRSAST